MQAACAERTDPAPPALTDEQVCVRGTVGALFAVGASGVPESGATVGVPARIPAAAEAPPLMPPGTPVVGDTPAPPAAPPPADVETWAGAAGATANRAANENAKIDVRASGFMVATSLVWGSRRSIGCPTRTIPFQERTRFAIGSTGT
jgi:hypothetical protein